jgi:hypothetical protein
LGGTDAGAGSTWAPATAAPLMAVADATAAMMLISLLLCMMLPLLGVVVNVSPGLTPRPAARLAACLCPYGRLA